MSTLLTINLKNLESATQNFYFFQQPAIYTGGAEVYSNSLWSASLANYGTSGGILTFQVDLQFYAGIQQAHGQPTVGQSSGFASAIQSVDLAPPTGTADDWTTASVDPLGLTPATAGAGVQPGAFRITTPVYEPPAIYNVGSMVAANGGVVLSNFVVANPNSNTDCQPVLIYYVQTGDYTPGTVMNFTQSSVGAAICDFTGGYTVIDVALDANGVWAVTPIQ